MGFLFFHRNFDGGKNSQISVDDVPGCDDSQSPDEETNGGDGDGATEIIDEKKTDEFVFSFKFQSYEEFSKSNEDDFGCCERLDSLSNRYEFLPEKSTSCFVGEAEIPTFKVEVLNSSSNYEILGSGDSTIREFSEKILESEDFDEGIAECSANRTEKFSGKVSESQPVEENTESSVNLTEEQILEKQRKLKQRDDFLSETDFPGTDSDTVDDIGDGFLSDIDFDTDSKVGGYEPEPELEDVSEEEESREEDSELETEWEHQELIEQLKMEMKKVRATGLATIYEESEAPKLMEELKPWKIDERFQHGDLMEELHKFYRTYRERMRKFDILNYQKMYAMG